MCCFPIANHLHPRARVCMIYEKDKRQIPRKTSRGLNWEKKKNIQAKKVYCFFWRSRCVAVAVGVRICKYWFLRKVRKP